MRGIISDGETGRVEEPDLPLSHAPETAATESGPATGDETAEVATAKPLINRKPGRRTDARADRVAPVQTTARHRPGPGTVHKTLTVYQARLASTTRRVLASDPRLTTERSPMPFKPRKIFSPSRDIIRKPRLMKALVARWIDPNAASRRRFLIFLTTVNYRFV